MRKSDRSRFQTFSDRGASCRAPVADGNTLERREGLRQLFSKTVVPLY